MKLKIQLYFYHNILTGGVKMDVMQNTKMNFLKNVKIYLAKIMFIEIISINLLII